MSAPLTLSEAAQQAVKACLPVLPMVGSPRQGYEVAYGVGMRGSWEEAEAAARALCELWRAVQ